MLLYALDHRFLSEHLQHWVPPDLSWGYIALLIIKLFPQLVHPQQLCTHILVARSSLPGSAHRGRSPVACSSLHLAVLPSQAHLVGLYQPMACYRYSVHVRASLQCH